MRIENHPVLDFDRSKVLSFTFEETVLKGYEGETIASALHANGIKVLRHDHRPRGFYCAIGNCSSCLMEVNGEPNVRVCIEPLVDGMVVKQQIGKGAFIGGEK
ncbi:MAG: (2Fe-2S)-binding protein [Acidaminobacter sp.]|uniref:(2Fe-2S)-binding protein n=1 Tax=Acidaminobacter sp. TaxID=1872102 RepID=UPI00137E3E35|nr:(2Fe-2S)-binding protein [Acidaminobacter sp.]MZQ99216.1 (2Fe-2S)-binding protein [Acidaminobacter sp.]